MRLRTFFFIALVLVALFAVLSFFYANSALLAQRLELAGGATLSVGMALAWAFALGVAVTATIGLARELGRMLERWRMRRAGRKAEEIEEEYSRGLVAVLEGREEEALRSFRAVLERDSRHFNTLIKLGEVLRRQGKHAEAIECHLKAHHLKPDSTRPLYALVDDHEAKGEMDRARAVLGKILSIDKAAAGAWRKLRALHAREQDWVAAGEAQARLERLSRGRPADGDRRWGLGIRYEIARRQLADGRTREATAGFRRLIKENESFIPAHVGLGEALSDGGEEREALEAWHGGFERTGSPIFLTLLENHHLQREEPMGAIEALKRCVARARRDTVARFYLGKLYFRLEMLEDSLAVLSSLEGRATYAPSLHYLLGRIHERRENWLDAIGEYRSVIKEMELVQLDYRCQACRAATMEWTDRCSSCGEWNTVEVNFREELSPDQLGLAPAPIYTTDD